MPSWPDPRRAVTRDESQQSPPKPPDFRGPRSGASGTAVVRYLHEWTQTIVVGSKGHLVLPSATRQRHALTEGTRLILFDSPCGLALLTRDELKRRVRGDFDGSALVGEECVIGAANWSEVAQQSLTVDRDWDSAKALLASYYLTVAPVTETDAEWAAGRWRRHEGLSSADRLCLALRHRLSAEVWTADALWADDPGVRVIR